MRAVVCHAITDDLSGVGIHHLPIPTPGPGQALVRVRAASVGFPDILLCQGKYQLKLQPPFTPGMNLAGEIAALGEAAPNSGTAPAIGAEVVGTARHGALAEYALVEVENLRPMPAALTLT
jgi:NADPH2:quinone reductase